MTIRNAQKIRKSMISDFWPSMPPIVRGTMVARNWRGVSSSLAAVMTGRSKRTSAAVSGEVSEWEAAARLRRRVLMTLIVLVALAASTVLASTQPALEHRLLQWMQISLFALLFAWVSAGCITAVMGFLVLVRGDRHMLSKSLADHRPLHENTRTAIVMPICNEDVNTVFAGLRSTCESLAATGEGKLFDIYILSDSSDPDTRATELAAWAELRSVLGSDRIYYRWRQRRTRRKAGNIADFCRRWGRNYRYMIVLDADSVMQGDCMTTLVRLMEMYPKAGILQTSPQAIGHITVHARAQQFAARVTGRLFTAGMQYWQLGEAHYWGHNAIIRVEPFMKHCALAALSGQGGLSGEILSHDFVEAALMRRAGYNVWLVPDLAGSYEQQPPDILSELQRDRRWCQGNLQNARLIAEPGLHPVHRGMLLTGAMAYLSAPLWLAYVALGVVLWLLGSNVAFGPLGSITPGVLGLWASTIVMLVLPRALGVLAVLLKGERGFYGGTAKLLKSAVIETGLSAIQAPIRMAAHTIFVVSALIGWKLEWKSPPREAADVPWREAFRLFAPLNIVVLVVAVLLVWLQSPVLIWLAPVGIPLLLAIPYTVLTSRTKIGNRIRMANLLLVPEELWLPPVLHRAWQYARTRRWQQGCRNLLGDLQLWALAGAAMGMRNTSQGLRGIKRREWIRQLSAGDLHLNAADHMRLLNEPESMQFLREHLANDATKVVALNPELAPVGA